MPAGTVNVDPTVPFTREELVGGLRVGRFRRVVFVTGAGISVAAGIPDFRTPKIGLYAQLKAFGLPHPEDIFSLDFLVDHPQPFYTVANRFLRFDHAKPSLAHQFIKRCADESILSMAYTQNIDGLELDVGIPSQLLVQAHGHMRSAHCCNRRCMLEANLRAFMRCVKREEVMHCKHCAIGIIKPDIILFGEKLPQRFRAKFKMINKADLVVVMGTSLKVQPFSSLIDTHSLPDSTPVVVMNSCNPGIERDRLLVVSGDIETSIRELMEDVGWGEPSTVGATGREGNRTLTISTTTMDCREVTSSAAGNRRLRKRKLAYLS